MNLDLHDLAAFAAVARYRSFRKAAIERGVSASALSHSLRGLEERLGLRLLNRTTRSVTPTEAGQRLLARLDPALQEVAEALADLTALQSTPTGTLRLNVPRPAARVLLGPILAKFAVAHPRAQIEVVTDDKLIDIVGEGFDAGIRFGEQLARDMVAVPIGPPQRFVVVASPTYIARKGLPLEPRELLAHSCICRRFPSGAVYAWEFQAKGQPLRLAVTGSLVLDDDLLMIEAARGGAGFAYVYEEMVREDLSTGRLSLALESWSALPSRFFVYYPSRQRLPPVMRAFVDFIST
ncbi:LysR family transcriptional regulator [Rhizobacter sp. Root1221]|uniref:LysR family transcriptional regulator n=1 Tax=Rhizobacter sp. Root1221 TaxID=1736433 RepID=UPI0006F6D7F0|nr:LysR family transcriptional regulator [Rhizobacter sp. Root1221]KQV94082.1 transcriptional regulator [Rhizobacter sp. Root1221]